MEKKFNNRQGNNIEILKQLSKLVDLHPDMRFGQILYNYVLETKRYDESVLIQDPFYEEPTTTLLRIKERTKHLSSHGPIN